MALHIQQLCAENHISVSYQSLDADVPSYYANVSKKHIHIRPTKNTGYYVSALHEIGHILGDSQTYNNTVKEREIGAWIWAMLNAKVWTDTADRVMSQALQSYDISAEECKEIQQRWNPCHRDDEEQIAV
tara:strand:- start:383 stop:772 length:390 start_codon:yes stop_codon:yes gene_type:complete